MTVAVGAGGRRPLHPFLSAGPREPRARPRLRGRHPRQDANLRHSASKSGDGHDALAAPIQVPLDVVEEGMRAILKRGTLILSEDGLLMAPWLIEAQEAKPSDEARQKLSGDRARDIAGAAEKGVYTVIASPPEGAEQLERPRPATELQRVLDGKVLT